MVVLRIFGDVTIFTNSNSKISITIPFLFFLGGRDKSYDIPVLTQYPTLSPCYIREKFGQL